jgi:hypothetical protein
MATLSSLLSHKHSKPHMDNLTHKIQDITASLHMASHITNPHMASLVTTNNRSLL